jgi:hypothetical protein
MRDPAEDWMTLMHDMDGDGWYVSIVNAERDLEVCAEADEYSPGPVIKPSVPIVGARHQRMLDDAVAVARTHELQRKLGIIPSAAELRDAMKENARG